MTKHTEGPTVNKCQCGKMPHTQRLFERWQTICGHCGRAGKRDFSLDKVVADWNRQVAAPDYHEVAEHILTRSEPNEDGTWTVRMNEMVELRTAYAKAEEKP